jgi:hypothetical protein
MEIALDPDIPRLLEDGRLLTLGNASCLLIEPSFQQLPPGWEQIIFGDPGQGLFHFAGPSRTVRFNWRPIRS